MLTPVPCLHVLFRVAAGPRIGFGHLVRARVLSRALGVERASLSLRGPAVAARTARRLGFQLERAGRRRLLDRRRPDVLVIDDPSAAAARPWCATARQAGVPVVSIHDLGLAFCGADLAVDGSIVEPRVNPRSGRLLSGVQYSILDPAVARARGRRRKPATVLIALGGGPRRAVAGRLATALCSADRSLRVRIAGGFSAPPPKGRNGRVTWLGPQRGLASELASCAAAVCGGGVSLYEAAVLDTPVVVWPVVRAQHPTAEGFARKRLAVPVLPGPRRVTRAVDAVLRILNPNGRRSTRVGASLLDGRGAQRVASAIARLVVDGRGARA